MKRTAVVLKFDPKRPRAKGQPLFIETAFTRRLDGLLAAGTLPSARDLRALDDYQRALEVIERLA